MINESTDNLALAQSESSDNLQNKFALIQEKLCAKILGQTKLVQRLLTALLSDGHLLVEGAPGLAKTRAVKELSGLIEAKFHRIQFTPDLLPSDLTGTDIFQPETTGFVFQAGPLFHNLVLADEVNRAPAKVQSALLEAMAERQITIGKTTHILPKLFMVLATQNPIEQEGTYPLPEAQLDRFLLHVNVTYPSQETESQIMDLARQEARNSISHKAATASLDILRLTESQILEARIRVLDMYMAPPVQAYIAQLVLASRNPAGYDPELAEWIEYGASPRGSISLERAARAHAWLNGKEYVSPDDVQNMVYDALRHRIILSFAAEAGGITADTVIDRLLELVPVP